MDRKKYTIELDGKPIAITYLEKADPPMGVVGGKIIFDRITSDRDRETGLILTRSIDSLKVFTEDRTEIKGLGAYIEGLDDEDGFEIVILGIAYPFYDREFPHHVNGYQNQFK